MSKYKVEIEFDKEKLIELIERVQKVNDNIDNFDNIGLNGLEFFDKFCEDTLLDAIYNEMCFWDEDGLYDMIDSNMTAEQIADRIICPDVHELLGK